MSLLTYKDARPWAKSIATQVGKGTMPPWHADPKHGEFLNDRRLSDADKATLVALGRRRRAGRQAVGSAGGADLRQRLDDRHARRGLRDERGLPDSGERRDPVSVPRDRDQAHGRQVGAGVRSEGRRSQGASITSSSTRGRRPRRPRRVPRRRRAAGAGRRASRAAAAGVRLRAEHGHSGRPVRRTAAAAGAAQAGVPEPARTGPRRSRRRRLRARAVHPRLSGRHRDEAAGRDDARAADALHDVRQGDDRSHAHRGQVREAAADDAAALGVAPERHAAHSGRRRAITASTPR